MKWSARHCRPFAANFALQLPVTAVVSTIFTSLSWGVVGVLFGCSDSLQLGCNDDAHIFVVGVVVIRCSCNDDANHLMVLDQNLNSMCRR